MVSYTDSSSGLTLVGGKPYAHNKRSMSPQNMGAGGRTIMLDIDFSFVTRRSTLGEYV